MEVACLCLCRALKTITISCGPLATRPSASTLTLVRTRAMGALVRTTRLSKKAVQWKRSRSQVLWCSLSKLIVDCTHIITRSQASHLVWYKPPTLFLYGKETKGLCLSYSTSTRRRAKTINHAHVRNTAHVLSFYLYREYL